MVVWVRFVGRVMAEEAPSGGGAHLLAERHAELLRDGPRVRVRLHRLHQLRLERDAVSRQGSAAAHLLGDDHRDVRRLLPEHPLEAAADEVGVALREPLDVAVVEAQLVQQRVARSRRHRLGPITCALLAAAGRAAEALARLERGAQLVEDRGAEALRRAGPRRRAQERAQGVGTQAVCVRHSCWADLQNSLWGHVRTMSRRPLEHGAKS